VPGRPASRRWDPEKGLDSEGVGGLGEGERREGSPHCFKINPTVPSSVGNKNHSSGDYVPPPHSPCSRRPFRLARASTRKPKKRQKNVMERAS